MKSYGAEESDGQAEFETEYPSLFLQRSIISPMNAPQDKPSKKRKKSSKNISKETNTTYYMPGDSNVRKFHKKFNQ